MQKVPALLKPRHSKTEETPEKRPRAVRRKEKLCALVLPKKKSEERKENELQHSTNS